MFGRKPELPPRPALLSISQITEDLENAPSDDPLFLELPDLPDLENDPGYIKAKENMELSQSLRELAESLALRKIELEAQVVELKEMNETIINNAQRALERIQN